MLGVKLPGPFLAGNLLNERRLTAENWPLTPKYRLLTSVKDLFSAVFPTFSVEILTVPLQFGTQNMGFSAQFLAKNVINYRSDGMVSPLQPRDVGAMLALDVSSDIKRLLAPFCAPHRIVMCLWPCKDCTREPDLRKLAWREGVANIPFLAQYALLSGAEKGVVTKGVFSLEEPPDSL